MKLDVKKIVEQAGQGVKDGLVVAADKAQNFASNAAAATAEEIDQIKESLYENKIVSDSIKPIQTVINDLKEDNAIPSELLELMQALLNLLCAVVDGLKHDNTTKLGIINAALETLEEWRKGLVDLDLKGMHIDHMTSYYGISHEACMDAYRILEKSGIEEKLIKRNEEKKKELVFVQLKKSNMTILLPNGYELAKPSNPIKYLIAKASGDFAVYQKTVESSQNNVLIMPQTKENAMSFEDEEGLIKGIHNSLGDNQGLIEVKKGKTKRGYDYIYSIVKTLKEEGYGVNYFLRMNIGLEDEIIEIMADFNELGMTGIREAMCTTLAMKAGLVESTDDGLSGWWKDPYDENFTKGIVMNLAEKEGIDGLFPYNPLTQARELVLSIVEDKYVLIKNEDAEVEKDSKEDFNEKETIMGMFVDRCRRHTVDILV